MMKRRSFVAALLCFCMMCWVAMPCFVFGGEIAKVEGSKIGTPEKVKAGETVTYTIKAKINGLITSFYIKDILPEELEYVGCDVSVDTKHEDKCIPDVKLADNELIVTPGYDDEGFEAFVHGDEDITVTVTAKVKDSETEYDRVEATTVVIGDPPVAVDETGDDPGNQAAHKDSGVAKYDDSPKCGDDFLGWLTDFLSFFRNIWVSCQ